MVLKNIHRLELFTFVIYLFLTLQNTAYAQSNDEYYTGAVVEYAPSYDGKLSPGKNMQNNIDSYEKHIKDAKGQGADIIVFPECGLTTTKFEHELQVYTSIFPDPEKKIVACNSSGVWNPVIDRLSCLAKNNAIYVVVNLPERMMLDNSNNSENKKYEIFNANAVFDRSGALIARYRKYNLFNEPGFNITSKPDLTHFKTDFNVTFGTFICFDILFTHPSLQLLKENNEITDIVYPTAWFSELPFLSAVQTQVGWARANGVNFLASGYSDPQNSGGGSGIYQASGNIVYNIPSERKSTLIVKRIKKIKKRVTSETFDSNTASINNVGAQKDLTSFVTLKENMKNYHTELLNETVENLKICHENLCCTFTIKFSPQTNVDFYYRMIVYDGPRRFANMKHNIQICGLAACKNESKESCGELPQKTSNPKQFDEIFIESGFIDEGNSVIFPSNVLYNLGVLSPSNFTFKSSLNDCERRVQMKTTTQVTNILGFGVYSVRTDSSSSGGMMSAAIIAVIVISVVVVIALVGFIIWRRLKNGNYSHPIAN